MAFSSSFDNPAAPGTGSAVSNREDLTSLLTQLDPTSTPLTSLAPKRKAKATNHEWTVDGLAAVDGSSGLLEGADVSSFNDKFDNRARLSNRIQGFRRDYMVSTVQQAVSSVGVTSGAAKVKCLREIKRDIEAAIGSANDKQTGSGTAVSLLRGLTDWIDSAGPSDVPTTYRTPAAQIITKSNADVTEADLNGALASMFNVSGNLQNVTCVADTKVRESISQFMRTGASNDTQRYTVSGTGKTIQLSVDLFRSDFGDLRLANSNPDCSVDTTFHDRAHIVNTEHYGVASLIPRKQVELDDQGGGDRGYCEAWVTLECLDPRAHGKIDEVRT